MNDLKLDVNTPGSYWDISLWSTGIDHQAGCK